MTVVGSMELPLHCLSQRLPERQLFWSFPPPSGAKHENPISPVGFFCACICLYLDSGLPSFCRVALILRVVSPLPPWMPGFPSDTAALPAQSRPALLTSADRHHVGIWRPFFLRPPGCCRRCGAAAPSPRKFPQSATGSPFCRTRHYIVASRCA